MCYVCLPISLHVCDKRERPLPVFVQWVLSKCAPCSCTVCVQSVYAFQRLKNAVVCGGVSHCLGSALSESVDALHACLRSGCFLLSWFVFACSSLPLTYTHNQWDEGLGGMLEEGEDMGGLFLVFLLFCSPSLCCLILPVGRMGRLFPKVREQCPVWEEEVELSLVLQFISSPLRFSYIVFFFTWKASGCY